MTFGTHGEWKGFNMPHYSLNLDAASFKQLAQSIIHLCVHIPCTASMYITTIHPQQRQCLLYSLGVMIGAHSSSRIMDTQAKDVMLAKEGIAQRFEHKHLRICMWGVLISLHPTKNKGL
jgi:hypothetical protein